MPAVCELSGVMPTLTHSEILQMMEPVGTVFVNAHARGLDVDISCDIDDHRPAVYAWVVGREIIYIGKAGRGLRRRMDQQKNGFRNSVRGQSHAEYLASVTDQGKVVYLYAMWPDPVEFRGQLIPSHSSVEDWLIATVEPKPVRNMARLR